MTFIRNHRRRARRRSQLSSALNPSLGLKGADAVEARRLLDYLLSATRRFLDARRRNGGPLARILFDALLDAHRLLDRATDVDPARFDGLAGHERLALIEVLANSLGGGGRAGRTGLDKRIAWLASLTGLSHSKSIVFALIARVGVRSEFELLKGILDPADRGCGRFDPMGVALLTGLDAGRVRAILEPKGQLYRLGLITERDTYEVEVADTVKLFLQRSAASPATMRAALLSLAPASTLDFDDFAHLKDEVSDARALVENAYRSGRRANILFYGAPGTGKTELARLLATAAKADAIEVGSADEDGDEPTRRERLLHLRLCRSLCGPANPAVLLIDEAEDLFQARMTDSASKIWLNRLVEDGRGVHIWIVNDLEALGEPVVRRMDLAIRFSTPPTATLRRLARKTMVRSKCSAADATVDRLAAMRASPAIIAAAVRTSSRIGWDEERLVRVTSDLAEASGRYSSERPRSPGTRFDPGLSRSDHDLARTAARLAGANRPWSLLLSGPPGTGKTAFGHHLAEVSGCDLLIRTGSDLLGCFVGQTEAAIAGAFREAERSNAILLIDEADSFLADRSRARQQWEASMVNEMLRQMDSGRTRFIATTNRADLLDQATARRFTLDIRFTAMTVDQAAAMFEARFGQPCPAAVRRIEGSTPGDFAQAADRASLLGGADSAELVRWLEAAVADRDHGRPMGF